MTYRALVGINYGPDNTRVEAGELHAFPMDVAEVLLAQSAIELTPFARSEPAEPKKRRK